MRISQEINKVSTLRAKLHFMHSYSAINVCLYNCYKLKTLKNFFCGEGGEGTDDMMSGKRTHRIF